MGQSSTPGMLSGEAVAELGLRPVAQHTSMAWLLLLAGLLATAYMARMAKSDTEQEAQQHFAADSDEILLKIESRLQAHKQVLLGGAAMFDASDHVSRQAWHTYVKRVQIDRHFNGILGLGFALQVPRSELNRHIAEIRKQGFPEYRVFPAGERDVYTPIVYLEPFKGRNLRAFGYDMYSEPVRRDAMEKARDKNIVTLSGKVTLVQETSQDVQAGTLMYVPVYKKSQPVETAPQRRAALYGWVYSPFRMNDLLNGILNGLGEHKNLHIHLQIYDGVIRPGVLLYESAAIRSDSKLLFTLDRHLDFNGQEWLLHFEQYEGSESGLNYGKAWGYLWGGIVLSLLLFFLALSYLNTRRNAARIAADFTTALRLKDLSLNATANAIMITDKDAHIEWANQAFVDLTGYELSEIIGRTPRGLVHSGRQDAAYYVELWQTILDGRVWHGELVNRRKDGTLYNEEMTITPVPDDAGVIRHFVAVKQDISERKQMEEMVRQMAFYDTLTQLPNRRLLSDRLRQVMASSKRSGRHNALMFLDLDNFKPLNDAHGHNVGDLLLIEVARRITTCIRAVDTVARFGGDEYVVVLSELDVDLGVSTRQAALVAEKIRNALSEPYILKLQHGMGEGAVIEHHCTSSIGVVMFINHEYSIDELLKHADIAMYQAKQDGRNRVSFFE